jgi:formylglycine-generating enzyme required for sulfatase activity
MGDVSAARPRVLISFSHDSAKHEDRVRAVADRLRRHGVECMIDLYDPSPNVPWVRWMETWVRTADFVLVVCTETYLRRARGEEAPGVGVGATWESSQIFQEIYEAAMVNTKFLPCVFDAADIAFIPTPLRGYTRFIIGTEAGYDQMFRVVTNQPAIPMEPVAPVIRQMPPILPIGQRTSNTWIDRYLESIAKRHAQVPIKPPGRGRSRQVDLDTIFVRPKLRTSNDSVDRMQIDWEMLLATPRLALTGDAGSGKSTLLRHIAVRTAQRQLQRSAADDAVQIPIVVDLAKQSSRLLADTGTVAARWCGILASELGLQESETEALLRTANILLLLDGLDEVPGFAERSTIVEGIAGAQRHFSRLSTHMNAVVACREAAWSDGDAYDEFERISILPMDRDQIHEFVQRWCLAVWGDDSERILAGLQRSLDATSAMREIAANPAVSMLLSSVEYEGLVPRQRTLLFEFFVQKLARINPQDRGEQKATRDHLIALAVEMQRAAAKGTTAFNTLRIQDTERLLGQRVPPPSGVKFSKLELQEEGRALLDELESRTGLLEIERAESSLASGTLVRFRHRLFQEYLAACHYVDHDREELLAHASHPTWSQVLAFTSGLLVRVGDDAVHEFLESVIRAPGALDDASLLDWAPRIAATTVCLEELTTYDLEPRTLAPARRAHEKILPLLCDPKAAVPLVTRIRIAEGLGTIRDPRLVANRWVPIPAGPFVFGSDADVAWIQERPGGTRELDEYWIQRWAVTVEDFRRFIENDGYATDGWWDDEARAWREAAKLAAPRGWEQIRSKGNRPITGVSWWEARAFCRWWTRVDVQLPPGWIVDLPSEAQWEKAARGGDDRPFPWGPAWQRGLANCADTDLQTVVPVGMFPAGHSVPHGLWDMAGNVSERCRDPFGPYEPAGAAATDYRFGHVVRGGAFGSRPLDLRVTYRFGDRRDRQDDAIGFRCVAFPGDRR